MTDDTQSDTLDRIAAEISRAADLFHNTPRTPASDFEYVMAEAALAALQPRLDMVSFLDRFLIVNREKFGPGERLAGTLDHMQKEIIEVLADPYDCEEWVDVALLALQGAARHGHTAEAIAGTLMHKVAKIEARTYPDWRTADPDKAIEHIREEDAVADS